MHSTVRRPRPAQTCPVRRAVLVALLGFALGIGVSLPTHSQFIGQPNSPSHKALSACSTGLQSKIKAEESAEGEERHRYFERAIRDLVKCTSYFPLSFDGWLGLGQVYAALGDHRSAVRACQRAQQLKPDNEDAQACGNPAKHDAASGAAAESMPASTSPPSMPVSAGAPSQPAAPIPAALFGSDTTALKEYREAPIEARLGYVAGMKDAVEFLANSAFVRVTRIDKAIADCIKLISVSRLEQIADQGISAHSALLDPNSGVFGEIRAAWTEACRLKDLTAPLGPAQQ